MESFGICYVRIETHGRNELYLLGIFAVTNINTYFFCVQLCD